MSSVIAVLAVGIAGAAVGLAVWILGDSSFIAWLRARAHGRRAQRSSQERDTPLGGAFTGIGDLIRRIVGPLRKHHEDAHDSRTKGRERSQCLDELPELIDVISLGLSAGVSFDAALEIYCARHKTMMARLLRESMRSWQLGMTTRAEALRSLARRLETGPFTTFVETVTESLDFGSPLVKILADQAESVRRSRRLVIEEQIEKAPVKMLIPTGTLILPAMLLAILGPLLASLIDVSW